MKRILIMLALIAASGSVVAHAESGEFDSGAQPPVYDHLWWPALPPVDITCTGDQVPVASFNLHLQFVKYICQVSTVPGDGEGGGSGPTLPIPAPIAMPAKPECAAGQGVTPVLTNAGWGWSACKDEATTFVGQDGNG